MSDFIVAAIIAGIIVFALMYIYRSKKQGNKCVGCPYSKTCGKTKDEQDTNCCNFNK